MSSAIAKPSWIKSSALPEEHRHIWWPAFYFATWNDAANHCKDILIANKIPRAQSTSYGLALLVHIPRKIIIMSEDSEIRSYAENINELKTHKDSGSKLCHMLQSSCDRMDQYINNLEPYSIEPLSMKRKPSRNESVAVVKKHKILTSKAEKLAALKNAMSNLRDAPFCGRTREKEIITNKIKTAISNRTGTSLYVCGAPGTGKTTLLETIEDDLISWSKKSNPNTIVPHFININALILSSANNFYEHLHEKLNIKKKAEGSSASIERALLTQSVKKPMIVMKIDEIDRLSRKKEIIQMLCTWANSPNSRLILIGIANEINQPLFLRNIFNKNKITFGAYSTEELVSIISSRVGQVFDENAILLCAKKVSVRNGDARIAINLCQRAVSNAMLDIEQLDESSKETPTCNSSLVTIAHVLKVASTMDGTQANDAINMLPFAAQILLCVAALLYEESANNAPISCKDLENKFFYECYKSDLGGVFAAAYHDMLSFLSNQGLVSFFKQTKKFSFENDRMISVHVTVGDVEKELNSNIVVRNMLRRN